MASPVQARPDDQSTQARGSGLCRPAPPSKKGRVQGTQEAMEDSAGKACGDARHGGWLVPELVLTAI